MNEQSKVTIIITIGSRSRIPQLANFIASIEKYTDPELYQLLIMIDNNDLEVEQYCKEHNYSYILSPFRREWVALTNFGVMKCSTELFLFICEDWECVQDNWLSDALRVFHNRFPDNDGLLIFNDGIQDGKIATHGLSSKVFVKAIGGSLLFPGYIHYAADKEVRELAIKRDKFVYCKDIKLLHQHWSVQVNPNQAKDTIYKKSGHDYFHQDEVLYEKRKRDNFYFIPKVSQSIPSHLPQRVNQVLKVDGMTVKVQSTKLSKVVWSYNIGKKEIVRDPLCIDKDVDYLYLTDSPEQVKSDVWKVVPIYPPSTLAKTAHTLANWTMFIRYGQLIISEFKKYDIAMYLDANIQITKSVISLFDDFIQSNKELGFVKHHRKEGIKSELEAMLQFKRENPKVIENIKQFYARESYDIAKSKLYIGGVSFTRLFSLPMRIYNSTLLCYLGFFNTHKDQCFIPYVIDYKNLHGSLHEMKAIQYREDHTFNPESGLVLHPHTRTSELYK